MVILCEKRSCIIIGQKPNNSTFTEYRVDYGSTEIGRIILDEYSKEWYLLITNKAVAMTRGFVVKLWDNFDRVSKATCPIKYWMG